MKDKAENGMRRMVGTAYIIDRGGTIHEVFDPAGWAFQFGLDWPPARQIKFEKRFVGIELASEGGLIEVDGRLYCFDRTSPKTRKAREDAFDYGEPAPRIGGPAMMGQERDELFEQNVPAIDRMHVPAGSMVKGLAGTE